MSSQIRKEINTPCIAHQVQLLLLLLPSLISLVYLSSLLPLVSSLPLFVCLSASFMSPIPIRPFILSLPSPPYPQ